MAQLSILQQYYNDNTIAIIVIVTITKTTTIYLKVITSAKINFKKVWEIVICEHVLPRIQKVYKTLEIVQTLSSFRFIVDKNYL